MSTTIPNRIVMLVPGASIYLCRNLAIDAARQCRSYAPKLTVASASAFTPVYGEGWFGVKWEHDYVWYQEAGTNAFTMRSLAGKTIPMWVNDPDGKERQKNPKAKVRSTVDGRIQVLIFRRAARIGQRKITFRNEGGKMVPVSVPASYPGAPGRIAVNRSKGILRAGDVNPKAQNPGAIAPGNVGVRWRHPGLDSRRFLARGMVTTCRRHNIPVGAISYQRPGQMRMVEEFRPVMYAE